MKNYLRGYIIITYRSLGFFMILLAVLVWIYFLAITEQKKALQSRIAVPLVAMATPAPTEIPPNVTIIPASHNDEHIQINFTSTPHPNTYLDSKAYSITYPSSWELESSKDVYGTSLSISKDGYMLNIKQYGTDGMNCIFEGELPKTAYVADLRKTAYTELVTGIGTFRRFKTNWNAGSSDKLIIGFCQEVEGNYRHPKLGSISYLVPKEYDESRLLEMDSMLQTIKIIN